MFTMLAVLHVYSFVCDSHFFNEMLAAPQSYSPSAQKAKLVLAAWQQAEFPIRIESFSPLPAVDLKLGPCRGVCRRDLEREFGKRFFNKDRSVADSLLYTSGALLAGPCRALEMGCAYAPLGGFHHAGYAYRGGFCTFNGLMSMAMKLLKARAVQRVMILDCDMHYGDGTDAILTWFHLRKSIRNASFGR